MTGIREAAAGDRAAPLAVVLTALAAGSPALLLPLMSDDWVNLDAVTDRVPWRTAFGYVRPLYLATFRVERALWGLTAWPYHAVSLALFALCALLVFATVRRLTADRSLAAAAGIVFAVNPFSIEALGWVAARADLLACAFGLASLWAWDRWRDSGRPLALAAVFASFAAAMLSKESAVVVPALIAFVTVLVPRETRRTRADAAAIAVMAGLALAHMLVLRPRLLGAAGDALPRVSLKNATGNLAGFVTAAVLPAPAEMLELYRRAAALGAGLAILSLWWAARRGAGRLPAAAALGAAGAALVGVPALVAFQERYFLFPSVGVALTLAALVRACRPGARVGVLVAAGLVWPACAVLQWEEWFEAGRASEAVVVTLSRESRDPAVREIVVANLPHRVRGAPVVTEFSSVTHLASGRRVPVILASRVDYRTAVEDGLDPSARSPVAREGEDVVVRLRISPGLYRRFVLPAVGVGETVPTHGGERVTRAAADEFVVRVPEREGSGRSVLVWRAGALLPASAAILP